MKRRTGLLSVLCMAIFWTSAAAAADDQFFDSNGVKIHYIVEGQGEPVVLIHGFTANIQTQWSVPGILDKLNKEYRVVAFDNRGHGKSDKPHDTKQYGVEMVNDVVRLMDHLKIPKAHIVGYSMGGFMTGYLMTVHPERVITATLGGAGWTKPGDERMNFVTELADSLDAGKGLGPLIVQLTPAGQPKPSDQQIAMINQMLLLTNDAKALGACIRGISGLAVTESQLKANKLPTLALIGEIDPIKVGVDELATIMPNLTVDVLPDADHMTAFAQPKFAEDLQAFLAGHSQAKPAEAVGAGAR